MDYDVQQIENPIDAPEKQPVHSALFYFKKYRHFFWALIVAAFIAAYLIAEKVMVYETYFVSYLPLDDKIPFLPVFVLAYYLWFPTIGFIGFWLLFTDKYAFCRYIWAVTTGLTVSMLFCIAFPNGQNLRPDLSGADGLFANMVAALYAFDTSTNVLPSMHVVGMCTALFAVFDSSLRKYKWPVALYFVITGLVICATVFIKQHSVLDIFTALPLAAIVYVVFYVFVKRRMEKKYAGLPRI
ncbi:MAG: hypothetical protein LBQ91_03840 [Oscillospiraceae bacterium]|jgi:membrane-associated phospholipid phosphatase|nr:hypothetical protein [Oscillospiraceae bacterium]